MVQLWVYKGPFKRASNGVCVGMLPLLLTVLNRDYSTPDGVGL